MNILHIDVHPILAFIFCFYFVVVILRSLSYIYHTARTSYANEELEKLRVNYIKLAENYERLKKDV